MSKRWTPESWRNKPVLHMPTDYPDAAELARVEDELRAIVSREKAVLAWGGRVNLSPADDVLISVERPLRIDTFEQMVASILSKKLAAGSTHLVLDIPVGPTAKVRSQSEAVRLRKLFEHVADKLGLVIDIVLTDGSQPIGRGIGPVLEARDVMAVLRNDADAPEDLRDHALMLAGRVLDFDPALKGGRGFARALELLASGAALEAMERLIAAQGRQPAEFKPGAHIQEICAPRDGRVIAIDCHRIARIARLAGAPMDKGAGIDLICKVGAEVRKGQALYRIHAQSATGLGFAHDLAREDAGYEIAAERLAHALGIEAAAVEVRRFPDHEALVRVPAAAPVVILHRSLDDPDAKLVELLLAASAARELGARRVVLVAPYLAYMRQDQAFRAGEAVSQRVIGGLLASHFDALLTVDPHLHRISSLSDAVPGIPAVALSAAPLLAELVGRDDNPLIVGPDSESLQWTRTIAEPLDLDML
ncbi:hypothetical protein LTR94_026106, partial [Friedmanniomyces endolithicus]